MSEAAEPLLDADDDDETPGAKKLSYEEALERAGFGRFHAWLLLVCGWVNASDAVEILCVSFLMPAAWCDLQLGPARASALSACVFLGMMVGGCVWGALADLRGRREVLVLSLLVNGAFGAASGLTQRFWLFLLLRFLSGVGVGGSIPVVFSYFCEFQPCVWRGSMVSALASFWMCGNLLAAGVAWLIIPARWSFPSWRVFVLLCSVPSLTAALTLNFLPESPKFLLEVGRETEALSVFQTIFRINNKDTRKTFPVSGLVKGERVNRESGRSRTSCWKRVHQIFSQMFVGHLSSRSFLLLFIFSCISFGYYGLWMWFPELFKKMEDGGSPCANASRARALLNESCSPVQTAVYAEAFLTAAANLPGNVASVLLMDRVGGKLMLALSLLVSGASVCVITALRSRAEGLVMACVFSGVSVISWNALDVIATQLYPTRLRSSALGVFTGAGRVAAVAGNLVFGQLLESECVVPLMLVSLMLLSGGVMSLRLPTHTPHTHLIHTHTHIPDTHTHT